MGHLDHIKATLKDVQTKEERAEWDEYCNNIYAAVPRVGQLKHMNDDEIYDHIRSMRDICRKYQYMEDERVVLAEKIVDSWILLDDLSSKDPNLKEDWENFLIVLKMIEE